MDNRFFYIFTLFRSSSFSFRTSARERGTYAQSDNVRRMVLSLAGLSCVGPPPPPSLPPSLSPPPPLCPRWTVPGFQTSKQSLYIPGEVPKLQYIPRSPRLIERQLWDFSPPHGSTTYNITALTNTSCMVADALSSPSGTAASGMRSSASQDTTQERATTPRKVRTGTYFLF